MAGKDPFSSSLSLSSATSENLKVLVLDSAAFVTGAKLDNFGADVKYYMLPDVVKELKDSATRHRVQTFPYKIHDRQVSDDALRAVSDFARKTGDIATLSATDLRVLALTYMLEKEHNNGVAHLRTEPVVVRTGLTVVGGAGAEAGGTVGASAAGSAAGGAGAKAAERKESKAFAAELGPVKPFSVDDLLFLSASQFNSKMGIVAGDAKSAGAAAAPADAKPDSDKAGAGADDDNDADTAAGDGDSKAGAAASSKSAGLVGFGDGDDEGEWITPDNVHQIQHTDKDKDKEKKGSAGTGAAAARVSPVACVTTDYAMQNVMLQMGLRLLSVNGMAINTLRQFVLRCHACFKITKVMDKQFCPSCGHNTLIKASVFVDKRGVSHVRVSNRHKINLRGTQYSIPKPRGGRHNTDLKLAEDEFPMQKPRQNKKSKQSDLFGDAIEFGLNKAGPSGNKNLVGYGRSNPNVVKPKGGKRRR